ncbi:type III polyketide synthase [Cellulomonas sp. PhB143]|uniref:type III polyketide synthase n=1 Tax=Cellulomonas sp. PhB143 TaxID=2485186 RepID=UPI000F461542|nr:3-oxoacyl-[acyl-carrier-protein] synthase III C-terminal domain-containing protein [Cellulomonas sp. PhB143]ROS75303.1 isopalmitoylresorcinol synthase [Cellulomonas sp. PhB143]
MSRVLAVGPVLPEHRSAQGAVTAALGPLVTPPGRRRALMERLHASAGVETRHLVLPLEAYAGVTSFGAANALFVREGTALAERACRDALTAAGVRPEEVDLLLFTSVTGVSAPSLDALLVQRLGLREDVRRFPSFGLGCVAGAVGLARAHDHLVGHPHDVVLLVSVELCSLTFQHGDDSTANLVASGLFGDGAAAVVLAGEAYEGTAPERIAQPGAEPPALRVLDSRSRLYPDTTDELGWDVRDTGFGIVLSAALPDVIRSHLAADVKSLLAAHELDVPDVGAWVVHAGGPKVVDAVRDALGLAESDVARTREILRAQGNLSSSSVLHVLAATTADDAPAPGRYAVLMAFGPGVSAELVLLRRDTAAAPATGTR